MRAVAMPRRHAGKRTAAVSQRPFDVRPRPFGDAMGQHRDPEGDHHRQHLVSHETGPSAGDGGDHQQDHRPEDREVGGHGPEPIERLRKRVDAARRTTPLPRRAALPMSALRTRSTEQTPRSTYVGRTPGPLGLGHRREEPHAHGPSAFARMVRRDLAHDATLYQNPGPAPWRHRRPVPPHVHHPIGMNRRATRTIISEGDSPRAPAAVPFVIGRAAPVRAMNRWRTP